MKKKKLNEVESDELDSEDEIAEKRKESVKKRRNAKKQDKAARWSGLILLILVMTLGFMMWVYGELNQAGVERTYGVVKTNLR